MGLKHLCRDVSRGHFGRGKSKLIDHTEGSSLIWWRKEDLGDGGLQRRRKGGWDEDGELLRVQVKIGVYS